MPRILTLLFFGLITGCMTNEAISQSNQVVYLDLIAIEGGQSKYPDPLRLGLIDSKPATLNEAVEALVRIVPAVGTVEIKDQAKCSIKVNAPLSDIYQDCKYVVCELLPERSRAQSCGYFVRLEQWIQREWLGGLCFSDGANENFSLTRWFHRRNINDCAAMSELVMVAYMQKLVGLRWEQSKLLLQSSFKAEGPIQP